ncbi:MAG: class I SAM-dependent methyltransferase [Candidatus Marinimicrobia bacterium]|nr:class I SAM-dependent methyltransferase [Candidatus Neomarinimicrobiota bacterium]
MADNFQKIEPYQRLAAYYDELMDYIDYDVWIEDVLELIKPFHPGDNWLDISCGTGSMAIKFAKQGKHMTAVDLSPDMIEIARMKATRESLSIDFSVGNMINFNDDKHYDVIINLHDGLNYILNNADTHAFMNNSYDLLKQEGVLLFDVVTPLLCQTHFRGYREIYHTENGGYERITNYDPITQLAESRFILNSGDDTMVEVESHIQKAYELSDVESFCSASRFTWFQILDDETLEKATPESERLLVMMRKQQ